MFVFSAKKIGSLWRIFRICLKKTSKKTNTLITNNSASGSFKNATQSYAGHHLLLKKDKMQKMAQSFLNSQVSINYFWPWVRHEFLKEV
jgi:hypothetical protein